MKWEIDTKLIINLSQKAKTGFAVDEMIFGRKRQGSLKLHLRVSTPIKSK